MIERNDIVTFERNNKSWICIYGDGDYVCCPMEITEELKHSSEIYVCSFLADEERDSVKLCRDVFLITKYCQMLTPVFYKGNYDLICKEDFSNSITEPSCKFQLTKWICKDFTEKVDAVWADYLVHCPSQSYCYFIDQDTYKAYLIYLRWRTSDPWSASLIQVDGSFGNDLCAEDLPLTRNYKEGEVKELKTECISYIKSRFNNILWIELRPV